jgi:hypothetical protein
MKRSTSIFRWLSEAQIESARYPASFFNVAFSGMDREAKRLLLGHASLTNTFIRPCGVAGCIEVERNYTTEAPWHKA